ncbi:hypothetical protein [Salsipaludibacter albus]|uniref:hypothetical protein n=1 Tax=Salsipaludibacter albus TaxID=2849650 RepID=UPI001EE4AE00|nr:hypothetical protein [Salsipaludibacter albus]MBY5161665.1 hypothetical protein [Salsipaludibacter albus]
MNAWVVAGDVVTSRRFVDRAVLLDGLDTCLAAVNAATDPVVALHRVDEDAFGGVFATLDEVLLATVRLRIVTDDLVLATVDDEDEPVDVRLGLADLADDATDGMAGPAWERATIARAAAQDLPSRPKWPPSLRTVVADDAERAPLVNAYLVLQDQLLARMDARDRRALVGLLDGERQVDIAEAIGVTQPAVARRVRDRGALAITRALRVLADGA